MRQKAIIVGAGTYGQVYAEYLKIDYDVIGFIDDNDKVKGTSINNIKVLGNKEFLLSHFDRSIAVFVPIGNNKVRVSIINELEYEGFLLPSFIHNSCIIDRSVKLGKTVYMLPGCHIMPLTTIGDYVMISMGVNIAHHNTINKGCFFSQGSNIGASIVLGENVFCGIGSTIMTGVKHVGCNSLIGAGATVIRDVDEEMIIVGNPGKPLKKNHNP